MPLMSTTTLFLVDNSKLNAKSRGLAYRNSKDPLDRHVNSGKNVVKENFEAWGSLVHGIDSGDGWIQVGRRYLPAMFNGVLCVVKADLAQSSKSVEHNASVLAAEVDGDSLVCLKRRVLRNSTQTLDSKLV